MKGEIRLVKLKELKPNPRRDFKVDPIDAEEVNILAKSINELGFWGGTVCRELDDGTLEIVAGHRRVAAALEAGEKEAELFVGHFDEPTIIRVYATENATQRGNTSTAITGSVASAARYLIKGILKGDEHMSQFCDMSQKALDSLRGNIASDKGLGAPIIERFLTDVPGMKESVIKEQIANLKASGDYARIVNEVSDEIEQERIEAEAELRRAEQEGEKAKETQAKAKAASAQKAGSHAKKAAANANGKKPTFDYAGVTKYLKNSNQINAFRTSVNKRGIRELLPVSNQAKLAAALVELAEKQDSELSSAFIKENITSLVIETRYYVRTATKEAVEELERHNIQARFERYQNDFSRNVRGMYAAGDDLLKLMEKHQDLTFIFSGEFRKAIVRVQSVIEKLAKEI
jgi:ParB-like chromosome segregation protein Spo0J